MQMHRPLKTGGDVDAYCSTCKMDLAHVIVAMEGTKPIKVECKTCKSLHRYRDAPRKKTTAATARAAAKAAAANIYPELMQGRDLSQAKKYRADATFEAEDVIDHKKFGLGLITRIIPDDKVEAVFENGTKMLVHRRG